MKDKYLKQILLGLGAVMTAVLSVVVGKGVSTNYKEYREERKKRYLADMADKKSFNEMKNKFRYDYSESHIVALTLDNSKISNYEERSYLYDKFNSLKQKALSCDYYDRNNYEEHVQECIDLEYILDKTSSDAISAKLYSMHKDDEEKAVIKEKEEAFLNDEYAHKRELEILEAKRQADLDIYKAKLNVEQAKLKTICEAMGGSSNKNINSTLNLKTDISGE